MVTVVQHDGRPLGEDFDDAGRAAFFRFGQHLAVSGLSDRQIYALRGNVAHGKPAHWAPQQWSQHEHLVAGAFIYPLVLKWLLAQHKLYALNEEDVAWSLGLEGLLTDRPFFEVPSKPQVVEASPGEDGALSVPDSDRVYWTRWQLRFDDINNALLGMALSQTISEVLDKE